MSQISITPEYEDGEILTKAQLVGVNTQVEEFLNVTKISADNIQDAGVGTDQLADSSVTAAKLASDSVTTAKILDEAVTSAKMADDSVATDAIVDGAVTPAKRAALGQQLSSSCGSYTNTGTSADVTNLSVSITTTGRPVWVGMIHDGTASASNVEVFTGSVTSVTGTVNILRAGSDISKTTLLYTPGATNGSCQYPVSSFFMIDTPAAGTYTYKVQAGVTSAGNSKQIAVINAKLMAFQL